MMYERSEALIPKILDFIYVIKTTLAMFAESFSSGDGEASAFFSFSRIKTEVLSGLTVALALVPEAVAFAFVAGVHPLVGLYAAFIVGLITALIGGRPGMISGATGALAVVMVVLASAKSLSRTSPQGLANVRAHGPSSGWSISSAT